LNPASGRKVAWNVPRNSPTSGNWSGWPNLPDQKMLFRSNFQVDVNL
jgi:hypothetical protein